MSVASRKSCRASDSVRHEKYIAANYKQIAVRWTAEFSAAVKQASEDSGESLAGYMRRSIEAQMERDREEGDAG